MLDHRLWILEVRDSHIQDPTSTITEACLHNFLGSSGNRVGSWKDVGGSQGSPLLCKEGRGEVEILPAYTNQGPPARHSL